MDVKTCIEKLGYVGVLNFATVDEDGAPQVRNISAIHYEGTDIYFLTARGKSFARQLYADGRVQISGYTRYKESGYPVRLSRFRRMNRSSGVMLFMRNSRILKMSIQERVRTLTRCL